MSRHPGEILKSQFLGPLGLNANRLAIGLGVNRSTVGRLLAGEQRLTPELGARLGAFFGVPARWWLLMQAEYDAQVVEGSISGIEPMDFGPEVLLTPNGVMRLVTGEAAGPSATSPLSVGVPEKSGAGANEPAGTVRRVEFSNGSVALLGGDK